MAVLRDIACPGLVGLVIFVSTFASMETHAAGPRLEFTAGGHWSLLTQPDDPPREPTLMSGTAFDGPGVALGPGLDVALGHLDDTRLGLALELLYSRHRTSGFERVPSDDVSRHATLTTDVLQFSTLVDVEPAFAESWLQIGVGPTLWVGLASDVSMEARGADSSAFHTTPALHGALSGRLAVRIPLSDRVRLPLAFRTLWNPFVGDTTTSRFRDFRSPSRPGRFEVAYDWQWMLSTGISFQLD
jgi:hypothetical protein